MVSFRIVVSLLILEDFLVAGPVRGCLRLVAPRLRLLGTVERADG